MIKMTKHNFSAGQDSKWVRPDIPLQSSTDKLNSRVQNPVESTLNHSRRPSRFVALHTNFAKKKSEAANPGGVVINLPNGKKYTEDDIRYLNNKRVFGTDSWALIPSAMIDVPIAEGSASLVAGNPMGHKERGLRTAANLTAGFGFPYFYSPGANIVDYNAYLDENTRRKSIGKDIPLPDKDDLDYMNAKLRYENSAVGRHPVLTGLTGLTSPIVMDAWRGIQNRGRAWKYGLGAPLAGGVLGAAAGTALGSVLGDPEAGAFLGGFTGSGLGGLTGGILYNTRGKEHYEAEKTKRKAEGRMY